MHCALYFTLTQEYARVDLGEVGYDPATEKPIDYHDISDITTATIDSTVLDISDEVSVHSTDKYITNTDNENCKNDNSNGDSNGDATGDTAAADDDDSTVYGVDDMTEDAPKQVCICPHHVLLQYPCYKVSYVHVAIAKTMMLAKYDGLTDHVLTYSIRPSHACELVKQLRPLK
jgi:hypothetical protein